MFPSPYGVTVIKSEELPNIVELWRVSVPLRGNGN